MGRGVTAPYGTDIERTANIRTNPAARRSSDGMSGGGGVGNSVERAVRSDSRRNTPLSPYPRFAISTHHGHDSRPKGRTTVPASSLPRLQAFPTEDLAFRRYVADAFAAVVADVETRPDGILEPEELQLQLRERYPAAVVRPRETLAEPVDGDALWYVYRFGSIAPGIRWWEEPGHAWAILDDDRLFVEVSTSLTSIVEAPREVLLGLAVETLSNPDDETAGDDVLALWGEFLDRGELHSTLRFRRLDGTQREIEYHVTREGAGPGRHLAVVREIERA
jgi:PAS domain-containing protein